MAAFACSTLLLGRAAVKLNRPLQRREFFKTNVAAAKRTRVAMAAAPDFTKGPVLLAKTGPNGVLGDCPFTQKANMALRARGLTFDVALVDLADKPLWFLNLNEDGTAPTYVDGATVLTSSDDIVLYADEKGTKGVKLYDESLAQWDNANDVVAPLFAVFVKLMKNKADDGPFIDALTNALLTIDEHLSSCGSRFLVGDHLSALDCNLAPKLQHIMVAGKRYKNYHLPPVSALKAYMDNVMETPEWKETAATEDVVIWGWSKFFT